MKKLLLLALLLAGAAEESYPVAAAPVAVAGSPTRMERTRRRLHRQSMQRIRRDKRRFGFSA